MKRRAPESHDPAHSTLSSSQEIPRRRFLHLIAASGAILAAGGIANRAADAAATPRGSARTAGARHALPGAMQREIRKQEKALADQLKVIRAYKLPPGSDPAVTFRAIPARREVR